MIDGVRRRVARQLAGPSGPAGRLIARLLNRFNAELNAEAVAALEVASGNHAVDLGFGGGVGLKALLATPAGRITGVERSEEMLAAARRRFAAESRVKLVRGSAAEIPLADGTVDRLMTVHSLYFWPDPAAGVAELRRVLAPGGRACVAIQPREAMEHEPLHDHGFRLYSPSELHALLEGAGFASVDVREADQRLLGVAAR